MALPWMLRHSCRPSAPFGRFDHFPRRNTCMQNACGVAWRSTVAAMAASRNVAPAAAVVSPPLYNSALPITWHHHQSLAALTHLRWCRCDRASHVGQPGHSTPS